MEKKHPYNLLRMFKLVKKDVKCIPPNVCTILIQQPWLTARRD